MKKSLKLLFFLLALAQGVILQAQIQRTYHWYFGGGAGIDFSSGQAVADTNGQVNTWEGCTTISDTDGNLLFYSDGSTVWNKNHQIMQNGTGLMGHWSSHQNSLIVPKPKDYRIYYIFTTDAWENNFQNGLRYSVVDMSLDNGLGAITNKNILLVASTHEQLAATHHANCEDIWVVTHKRDEEKFYAYLVTENGVSNTPVITEIGNAVELLWGCSSLKISPDGTKIASSNYWDWDNTGKTDTIELYDFNKNSGILTNKISLSTDTTDLTFSFAPNSLMLYVMGGFNLGRLYQYDLTSANIQSSKVNIYNYSIVVFTYDSQISSEGNKIFFTRANTNTLAVLDNPNSLGTTAIYQDCAFSLNGKQCMASFPNFISSYFDTDSTSCFPTLVNENFTEASDVFIYPNPADGTNKIIVQTNYKLMKSIKLFTITGKEVLLINKNLQNEVLLDISSIPCGIYLLQLTTETKTVTKKIVIQNE